MLKHRLITNLQEVSSRSASQFYYKFGQMKETCLNCKQNKTGGLAANSWNLILNDNDNRNQEMSKQVKMEIFFKILILTARGISMSKLSIDFNKSGNKVENFWYSTGDDYNTLTYFIFLFFILFSVRTLTLRALQTR